MLKFFRLCLILVISSHFVLLAKSADDEFAEFDSQDEIDVNILNTKQNKQPAKDVNIKNTINAQMKVDNVLTEDQKQHYGESNADQEKQTPVTEDEGRSQKKPNLKLVNAPMPRVYKWESYSIEIAFLLASFMYFVNFFVGSGKNNTLAHLWFEKSRALLKQQFSLVGGSPQFDDGGQKRADDNADSSINSALKKQKGLIKTTESTYTIWNSGRIGMDGMLVELNLLKRQDLFSMGLNLIKPKKDSLILRFLLNQDGYENFVFCLAHKTQAPRLVKDMVDISTFCPKRKLISQHGLDSDRLFVMSELTDVASFLLDQKTLAFLKKNIQSINYIHITDQFSTLRSEEAAVAQKLANPKRMATFSFNLPHSSEDSTEFLTFALSTLDRLRRFKLARDSKQKSDKNRQKIIDILQKTAFSQKQEAAQNKREELRRLEKERIYNEDDPVKQMKWEKKEAKRDLKKSKMRVKQLKVKSM